MLAHLINQRVLGEFSALEIVFILLNEPTADAI